MAIANSNEEKPLIIFTFKDLCNGKQWLAAQHCISIIILTLGGMFSFKLYIDFLLY